jgi:hypothetical protein
MGVLRPIGPTAISGNLGYRMASWRGEQARRPLIRTGRLLVEIRVHSCSRRGEITRGPLLRCCCLITGVNAEKSDCQIGNAGVRKVIGWIVKTVLIYVQYLKRPLILPVSSASKLIIFNNLREDSGREISRSHYSIGWSVSSPGEKRIGVDVCRVQGDGSATNLHPELTIFVSKVYWGQAVLLTMEARISKIAL